jgi:hypothetical protein
MRKTGGIMSEENTNEAIPATVQNEDVVTSESNDDLDAVLEDVEEPKTLTEKIAEELSVDATISVVEEPINTNVISSGSQKIAKPSDVAGLTAVAGGVIGTGTVKRKPAAKQPVKAEVEKVAVYSTKNVTWPGVGKVYKGYNIVTKEQAEKWSARDHIRIATPEEVAQEFGR